MQISLFSRAELLLVALGELKEAEHHLATARAIREDGHDAHNVGYWEKEVARRRAKVAALSACDQCGASGEITVTDAGDFCSCGAEVRHEVRAAAAPG